jgi:CheY-like chemotaxis protein
MSCWSTLGNASWCPAGGTRFWFSRVTSKEVLLHNNYLPAPEVPAEPRGFLRKRILLADDHQSVRQTIRLLLRLDEHTVVEADNGAEALALFQREHFDLVITDFEMPVMKGDELALRIKQILPSQPILLITAHQEQLGACDIAVDAILCKPFHLEDLRQAMAELVS